VASSCQKSKVNFFLHGHVLLVACYYLLGHCHCDHDFLVTLTLLMVVFFLWWWLWCYSCCCNPPLLSMSSPSSFSSFYGLGHCHCKLFNTHTHACECMTSKISQHTKLLHVTTNIGAINSKQTKIYVVTKNYGLLWKFMTPCCQMACNVIIAWKIESLLITKNNNILN